MKDFLKLLLEFIFSIAGGITANLIAFEFIGSDNFSIQLFILFGCIGAFIGWKLLVLLIHITKK